MDRVGFQQRAAAFLIDLGVVMIVAHLIVLVDVLVNESGSYNYFGVVSAGGTALLILSYGLMEFLSTGTLGKHIMGLTIAMDDGAPALRGRLMRRWAIKQAPIFFGALATFLFIVSDRGGPLYRFDSSVRDGLFIFAWIDVALAVILLVFVIIGCLRVRQPSRQAFHDAIAGTAIYRRMDVLSTRGFAALVPHAALAEPASPPPVPPSLDVEHS
jgi:uncharacterized RDD family membrane protein YckC